MELSTMTATQQKEIRRLMAEEPGGWNGCEPGEWEAWAKNVAETHPDPVIRAFYAKELAEAEAAH